MHTATVQHESSSPTIVMPRLSVEMAGALACAFGAWGGIVPFVGPIFGFSADGTASWTWNLTHAVLFVAPGAAAFVGGLLIVAGSRAVLGRHVGLALAGALVAVAGAWFIVGPIAWPVLKSATVFSPSSALRSLEYWIGYSLGPGGILIALGSFAFARPTPLVAKTPLNTTTTPAHTPLDTTTT